MTVLRRPLLPWLIWAVAALAYAVAIVHRSSLAALGPAAQQHFGIDATTLASFAVVQLAVYAGMQIPVGMLLDRFGATVMIFSGGVLMALGQIALATVHEVSIALAVRVLVGAGDACTFISLMRMLPEWFSVRQLPLVSQLTGIVGQAGQLVSVTPLAILVGVFGWLNGFIGVAAAGLCVSLLGAVVLRDAPGVGTVLERVTGRLGHVSRTARSLGSRDNTALLAAVAPPATALLFAMTGANTQARGQLSFWRRIRSLLRLPGVRLAFWVHFTPPFAAVSFVLLWGTPMLRGGFGLSQAAAAWLLSVTVVSGMVAGLLLGSITSRFVEQRVWIVLAVVCAIVLVWTLVLLWPGVPPLWLLTVLMVVISVGGPASLVSFEVGRSHTPKSFAGFGTGLVNTGGFIAALLVIFLIGLALDLQGAGSPEHYTLTAFRWAFAVQLPFWLLGITMIVIEHRRTSRWMRRHGRSLR